MSLKKKTIALFLVTFVILIIIPSMVNATTYSYSDTEQGIEWLYELDSGGNVVNLKCNTTSVTGTVTIPSTIEGKTVISVGSDAFKGRIALTSITIPSTVKEIEYSAFEGCTNLSSVDLGNVEAISFDVFKGCTSLTSITIPKSLKSGAISPVFTNCTNLTNITLEEGLTVVPSHLCATTGITEIAIPSTVKEIEYSAFEDCAQLEKITILDNVEKIGFDFQAEDYVFVNHNDNLTIYCYEGTVAAEYAKEKDIKFVYLQKTTEGDENQGTDNKDENEQNTTDGKKDDTTAKQELPKAGKMTIISILIAAIIAGTTSFIKTKKYKEI